METNTKPRVIFVFICMLIIRKCAASFNLGECSLDCDQGQHGSSGGTSVETLRHQLQGPAGKRGPQGSRGPAGQKGDTGEPFCNCSNEVDLVSSFFPKTCSDLVQTYGVDASGVYTIYPFGNSTGLLGYCDLVTAGGGWLLFQRRLDGSEDFYRNFNDYVKGFGKLNGEFWLGLDTIHQLTKDGEYELRADMKDFDNQSRYAHYRNFAVGSGSSFVARISGYAGNAAPALANAQATTINLLKFINNEQKIVLFVMGDGLHHINGQKFSAKDLDQDISASSSCALSFKGGWWYSACHGANPNGLYHAGNHSSYADGIDWRPFRGYYHSMKTMELKIRKKI